MLVTLVDKRSLWEEGFVLVYGSKDIPHNGGEGMDGARSVWGSWLAWPLES